MVKQEPKTTNLTRIEDVPGRAFTYQYAQPEEYTFCQDSIIFPVFVAERLKGTEIGPEFRALDLCAGCGVIGFELAYHVRELERFDFLEIQDVFRGPFEKNLAITGHAPETFRFVQENYEILLKPEFRQTYDLIVANPPYFHTRDGKLSPSQVKNRCRFFVDSSLETLVHGVANALKAEGRAYLLVKSGERHGQDTLGNLRKWLAAAPTPHPFECEIVADIRGTWVAEIKPSVHQGDIA